MPGLVASGHSHRPTTKVSHKAFKSRKATKGALRDAAKGMTYAEMLIATNTGSLGNSIIRNVVPSRAKDFRPL